MTLSYESTHEYHFNRPGMYYCDEHNTLRICNNFEDSILISGISRNDINEFIEKYHEYVLKEEYKKPAKTSTKKVTS